MAFVKIIHVIKKKKARHFLKKECADFLFQKTIVNALKFNNHFFRDHSILYVLCFYYVIRTSNQVRK